MNTNFVKELALGLVMSIGLVTIITTSAIIAKHVIG